MRACHTGTLDVCTNVELQTDVHFPTNKPDGSMLTLDQLLRDLSPAHREELQRASTSTPVLAVQEHPTLCSLLCFVLHPCGTRDVMAALLNVQPGFLHCEQQCVLKYLQAWWKWTACVRV